jgi:hypothetical protein
MRIKISFAIIIALSFFISSWTGTKLISSDNGGIIDTFPNNQYVSSRFTLYHAYGGLTGDSGFIVISYTDTTSANGTQMSGYNGAIIKVGDAFYMRSLTPTPHWTKIGPTTVAGGPFTTSNIGVGFNPGTNITLDSLVNAVWYQSKPPTATLTGGTILEITTAGTQSKTLNWSASRQDATKPLATITITGNAQTYPQTFSQPGAPGTVSGTQSVNVTNNTTNTFTNTVVTTDGKTAIVTTTFPFESKYYIGFVPNNTPSSSDLIAATGGTVGGTFATSRLTSGSLTTPPSSEFVCFAYPASFGLANAIIINGLSVTYNLTVQNVTNASGGVVSYNVYVSPAPTSGGISSYQVQ